MNGSVDVARDAIITIDGPSGTGKSTAGVWLAHKLGLRYLETGFLFRGLALAGEEGDLAAALERVVLDVEVPPHPDWRPTLRVAGVAVSSALRSPEVESTLAALAARDDVRAALAAQSRQLVAAGGCVVVGRRTSVEVAPDALVHLEMTADADVRARRRALADAPANGGGGDHGQRGRLQARDQAAQRPDSVDRGDAPAFIDTSRLSVDEMRSAVLEQVAAAMRT